MQDETWRMILRWAFLLTMIATTFGMSVGMYLLFRVHRAHERTLDLLIAWGRDSTGHLSEPLESPKPDESPSTSTMGCDPTLILTVAPALFTRMSKMVRG